MILLRLLTYSVIVVISAMIFGAKGPVILTFLGAFALFANLLNIGLEPESFQNISKLPKTSSIMSHKGPLIIYHSHHSQEERLDGKEFRIGYKYFCTGCYGILLGTSIAIVLIFFHLINGISKNLSLILILSVPLWFIPIILRYTLYTDMKTIPCFLSNMFLPIGCSVLLVFTDLAFQSWILNVLVVILIEVVVCLRGFVSVRKENRKFPFRRELLFRKSLRALK